MNKKKTWIGIGLAAVIAVVVAAGCWWYFGKKETPQVSGQPIKIGSILQLSGDFAIFGEPISQGAQLAIDEAKARGIDVKYVSEDDHSDAKGAANAANKLVNVDKVHAVLTATVQQVKPIASVFNLSQVPLLATWDSNDYIKSAGQNIFTIGFSTEAAGQLMATYAYHKLHVRKVDIISQKDEWSELIASAFEKKFKELGGKVSVKEQLQPTQRDFRTQIAKAKTAQVDGVYFPFPVTGMASFLIQSKQLGLNAVMMTGDGFSPAEIEGAKSAAEGVYLTNLYNDDADELTKKYKAKYGKESGDPLFVAFGYDGVNTILAAAQVANAKNISMRQALGQVDIQGTDHRIKFGGKQYSEKYERLYKVVNGQFVQVK